MSINYRNYFTMSSSTTMANNKKGPAWKWTKPIPGDWQYFLCEDHEPIRTNPYDCLNPLLECHSNGSDGDISDYILAGDLLLS